MFAALSEERNSTAACLSKGASDSSSKGASDSSSTEASNSSSTAASDSSSTEADSDSTAASNYSSTDADSDSTIASKRSSTKRARAESDLDDTRALKRVRAESELDGMRASKSAPSDVETNNSPVASERAHREGSLHMLVQAVEFRGQNAAASETAITNPVTGPYTMQLNNELSLNSGAINAFLAQNYHTPNLPDM
ncbi:hypothetical protein V8C42DRAFT_318846 [Trichoderma barbatum]